jgi:hypothetical protein
LDVWYVDHLSFKTDLKVITLTIKKALKIKFEVAKDIPYDAEFVAKIEIHFHP